MKGIGYNLEKGIGSHCTKKVILVFREINLEI